MEEGEGIYSSHGCSVPEDRGPTGIQGFFWHEVTVEQFFNVVVMCKTSGMSERSCDQSSSVAEGQASLQHVSSLCFKAMIF